MEKSRTLFCTLAMRWVATVGMLFCICMTHLGHIRTVPACNRGYDNHFIVLSHWNITPQAQSYDISTGHIILTTGQPVFSLNYTLYLSSALQGSFNYQFEIFCLIRPIIEPGLPRHGANALTTSLQRWLIFKWKRNLILEKPSGKLEFPLF